MSKEAAVLKIELAGAPYPLWRRVQVDLDTTLEDLHTIIQILFFWDNAHLHHFIVGKEIYSPENDDEVGDFKVEDEKSTEDTKIKDILKSAKKFIYEYDFGDSWIHNIIFEKFVPQEDKDCVPVCLGAKGGDALEDIGGIGGFADFLEKAKQKKLSEETLELLDWCGLTLEEVRNLANDDPDIDEMNEELRDFWMYK